MKTQISILVKNEPLLSRFFSFMWIVNIFKKMSVNVWIDNQNSSPIVLKADKTPYKIDVTPGYHSIIVTDCRAKNKQTFRVVTGAIVGGAFGLAGGVGSAVTAATAGADMFSGATIRDGVVECNLNEGDVLKISVKPKSNGSVKIKILK